MTTLLTLWFLLLTSGLWIPPESPLGATACDPVGTCHDHGICWMGRSASQPQCACSGGFTGSECSQCALQSDVWPTCQSYDTFQPVATNYITNSSACGNPIPFTRLLVVRPLAKKQFAQLLQSLQSWSVDGSIGCDPAALANPNADLMILTDVSLSAEEINATIEALGVAAQCFGNLQFDSAQVGVENNIYEATNASGPNQLFYHMMLRDSGESIYSHMLWMEPDMYAVQNDWLPALIDEIMAQPYAWMLGAIYVGFDDPLFKLATHRLHLNGNAVYALGSGCLRELFQGLETNAPFLAFDLALDAAFRGAASGFKQHYVPCDFIVNMWDRPYSVLSFASSPVLLVHGKFQLASTPATILTQQCLPNVDNSGVNRTLDITATVSVFCPTKTSRFFVRLFGEYSALLGAYLDSAPVWMGDEIFQLNSTQLLSFNLSHPIPCTPPNETPAASYNFTFVVDYVEPYFNAAFGPAECGVELWFIPGFYLSC